MKLPEYSDDEVRVFHPICESALNSALRSLRLENDYEVTHHESINGIIPDFVIKNKKTKKYLLIIEVKRTPSQVSSTRYKNQAQSYILEAENSRLERPYFVLTNLEVTNFFKYDTQKTSVNNQVLEPSPIYNGTFEDDYNDFQSNLTSHFEEIIKVTYEDKGQFVLSYNEIIKTLSSYITDEKLWHSAITVIGYEFIRSILKRQRPEDVSSWKNAIRYKSNPKMLQQALGAIDFKSLTLAEISKTEDDIWVNQVLREAEKLGDKALDGDEFASIAHDLLIKGKEHEGLVPTDEELSAALVSLTVPGSEYSNDLVVCDPASGSGNLVSAFINRYSNFPSKNIWLNDRFKQFQDILTIRFGLKYSNDITPSESPKITSNDLVVLKPEDFQNVDVVLMNPPYLSGVSNLSAKIPFVNKIVEYTNHQAITNIGQMPLEGPFLELLLAQIKNGTKIGVVYPESHLFAKGREAVAIRKLLLEKFGLKKIFTYPREGIFSDVTKGTVVLVGEKGQNFDNVKILSSYVSLDELDFLDMERNENPYGITTGLVPKKVLENNLDTGWKFSLFPEYEKLIEILNAQTEPLKPQQIKRGPIGSSGGTDYIFPNKLSFWADLESIIPNSWLVPAIENTRDMEEQIIKKSNIFVKALCPPEEAFVSDTAEFILLNRILDVIDEGLETRKRIIGRQYKQSKTRKQVLDILKNVSKNKEKNISKKGTILIPRFLRKEFKLYLVEEDIYVSSNFAQIFPETDKQRKIIISWLFSVYGQFQLEYLTKPQEGGRKMEMSELKLLKFPKTILSSIVSSEIESIPRVRKFLDFYDQIEVDDYWVNVLKIEANDRQRYQNIMYEMVSLRNP